MGAPVPSSPPLGLRLVEGATNALGAVPFEAVGACNAVGPEVVAFPALGARLELGLMVLSATLGARSLEGAWRPWTPGSCGGRVKP